MPNTKAPEGAEELHVEDGGTQASELAKATEYILRNDTVLKEYSKREPSHFMRTIERTLEYAGGTQIETPLTDEELRSKVSDMLANLMIEASLKKLSGKGDLIEQGRRYIAEHNETLNTITSLIAARERKAVEKAQDSFLNLIEEVDSEADKIDGYISFNELVTQGFYKFKRDIKAKLTSTKDKS